MSSLTLPQRNGASVSQPADVWLQSSVQTFFSVINWDDHPQEVSVSILIPDDDSDDQSISLAMSVGRFFAQFNWEGDAIAAPSPTEIPQPKSQEFTLDDFSDLF